MCFSKSPKTELLLAGEKCGPGRWQHVCKSSLNNGMTSRSPREAFLASAATSLSFEVSGNAGPPVYCCGFTGVGGRASGAVAG